MIPSSTTTNVTSSGISSANETGTDDVFMIAIYLEEITHSYLSDVYLEKYGGDLFERLVLGDANIVFDASGTNNGPAAAVNSTNSNARKRTRQLTTSAKANFHHFRAAGQSDVHIVNATFSQPSAVQFLYSNNTDTIVVGSSNYMANAIPSNDDVQNVLTSAFQDDGSKFITYMKSNEGGEEVTDAVDRWLQGVSNMEIEIIEDEDDGDMNVETDYGDDADNTEDIYNGRCVYQSDCFSYR